MPASLAQGLRRQDPRLWLCSNATTPAPTAHNTIHCGQLFVQHSTRLRHDSLVSEFRLGKGSQQSMLCMLCTRCAACMVTIRCSMHHGCSFELNAACMTHPAAEHGPKLRWMVPSDVLVRYFHEQSPIQAVAITHSPM